MTKKSPIEVRRAIAADFKLKGITHIQAAKDLGYKNKQSIASILSNKSASYLPQEQALRFFHSYNYNPKFLMTGEGQLYIEKADPMEDKIEIPPIFNGLSPEILACIINIAEGIIYTTTSKYAQDAWTCVLKGDYDSYKKIMENLSKESNSSFGPIIPPLARYTIEKLHESQSKSYGSIYIHDSSKDDDEA